MHFVEFLLDFTNLYIIRYEGYFFSDSVQFFYFFCKTGLFDTTLQEIEDRKSRNS